MCTGKVLEGCKQSLTGPSTTTPRDRRAESHVECTLLDNNVCKREAGTLTAAGLEAILVVFWQSIWLPSDPVRIGEAELDSGRYKHFT